MVQPDLSVFSKNRGFSDYQRANEEFQFKKQLAQIQAAESIKALQSDGLSAKDLIGFQIQMQNNQANQDIRREQLESTRQTQLDRLDDKKAVLQEKKDLTFRNDQNLLANATRALDKQIASVDTLFDGDKLKGDVSDVYGTFMGFQAPITFQGTRDAKTLLDQVNANAFMSALGDMKNQSATGASGLGALSEREGDKVQAAATSAAETRQSPEAAAKALKTYRENLLQSKKALQSGFQNIYKDMLPAAPAYSPEGAKAELARRAAARNDGGQ